MTFQSNKYPGIIFLLCALMLFFSLQLTLTGCQTPGPEVRGDETEKDIKTTEAAAAVKETEKEADTKGSSYPVPSEKNDKEENKTGAGEKQESESAAVTYDPITWEGDLLPNELGQIMVLMYHEIGHPESEWRRTPENFRRDLQTLYDEGYRLVSLTDMINGDINIPAGTSPVVLTFDDSTRGQFNYLENDSEVELDPDCAVAIMEDFYARHPDFGLAATFYIFFPNPFRQQSYIDDKLNYLVDRGFEIGNHTYGHANLSRLGPVEVQRELALHQKHTEKYVPGYMVRSLALPYGASPRDHAELLLEGSYEGTSYVNDAVLLVGANPAPSPFHVNFNPARLPRVRASEMNTEGVGMYEWLERFADNPERRYVSDGNPHNITVPRDLLDSLDENRVGDRTIVEID